MGKNVWVANRVAHEVRLYSGKENYPQAIQLPQGVPLLRTDHEICILLLSFVSFPLLYLATFEVIGSQTTLCINF